MSNSPNKPIIDERFRIVKPIGEGTMGAVFIAIDGQTGQPVALKVLKKSEEAMRASERFSREIRFLETLAHPNIVNLIQHGRDARIGVQYFAMELLFGDPISKLTSNGRSSPALALMVARQTAEGIATAHELGIVHRDLKPANLMLVPVEGGDVRLKILDFGLAYAIAEERLTEFGNAPGTVSYMPPEQLQGIDVDHRGDLYGLGVVLFEMLTGRSPFPGTTQVEIARGVLELPARRLDDLLPEVPHALADLVASLLAKRPEDRPQNADDLVEIIASFQRSSALRPISVKHAGPSLDPVRDWQLGERLSIDDVKP